MIDVLFTKHLHNVFIFCAGTLLNDYKYSVLITLQRGYYHHYSTDEETEA